MINNFQIQNQEQYILNRTLTYFKIKDSTIVSLLTVVLILPSRIQELMIPNLKSLQMPIKHKLLRILCLNSNKVEGIRIHFSSDNQIYKIHPLKILEIIIHKFNENQNCKLKLQASILRAISFILRNNCQPIFLLIWKII